MPAAAYINQNHGFYGYNLTTITMTWTVPADCTFAVMSVTHMRGSAEGTDFTSCNVGGVAGAKVISYCYTPRGGTAIMWYVKNPALGSQVHTWVLNAQCNSGHCSAVYLRGVNLLAPVRSSGYGYFGVPSFAFTGTQPGDMGVCVSEGGTVPGGGETAIWTDNGAGSYEAASTGMSWNATECMVGGLFAMGLAGGGQILILAAERWKQFARDLKAGLVPPDVLRRRYRDLVTI